MPTKCTLFFEVSTVYGDDLSYRVGGWSETYYHGGVIDTPSVNDAVVALGNVRAKILPKQASIVASRQQTVTADGKPGKSKTKLTFIKGNASFDTDVPQMAYAMRGHAAGQNMRMMELRCFPDEFVSKGEAKLTDAMTGFLRAYKRKIIDEGWMFRGIKMDVPTVEISTISGGGAITVNDDFVSPGVGKKVQVLRTKVSGTRDDFAGGNFKVLAAADARHITIAGWDGGECENGRLRAYSHDFFPITSIEDEAIFVRKVGRPFFQYRGRASSRP